MEIAEDAHDDIQEGPLVGVCNCRHPFDDHSRHGCQAKLPGQCRCRDTWRLKDEKLGCSPFKIVVD